MEQGHKTVLDVATAAVGAGTLIGWLPSVAAAVTIAWYGIRIYETRTVQRWLGRLRGSRS